MFAGSNHVYKTWMILFTQFSKQEHATGIQANTISIHAVNLWE